ncbi:MAG: alkaline phosphatase D family protein [Solirubrobacteraceae bacterium]
MARLVLGPLQRYAGADEAAIWVETDGPCEVEVLGCSERTFHVAGHHYALVHCTGLQPGSTTPYEVRLDGERVWPQAGSHYPASAVRTLGGDGPFRIAWGSCRVTAPHEPPHSLTKDEHPDGREVDALRVLADHMRNADTADWPHALVLLGDQVYADEVSPDVRDYIRAQRDIEVPPEDSVANFEEYTRLYREAWSEPHIRWLLSTLPTAMIFDDHDVHDDWNTSQTWVDDIRAQGWWDERIVGGFASYWLYQHIGNLAPHHLAEDDLHARLREADDGWPMLSEYAFRADREVQGTRWSYCRDFGRTRLIMLDSRAGRVLHPPERRSMLDPHEWAWLEEHAQGDFDHLLIGTSLPMLLAPALHYLESWNEAVCDGAWGGTAALVAERMRQGLDLEHWPAFGSSLERVMELMRNVGTGANGKPPASIVALSGDVHHAYLAEVGFPRGTGMRSPVYQATCSPFRNPLDGHERRGIRFAWTRAGLLVGKLLARSAGVSDPPVRWRFLHDEPYFDNQVAFIELDGRRSRFWLQKTVPGENDGYALETVFERRLS